MKSFEIMSEEIIKNRRKRLKNWIDTKFASSQTAFIRKTGINQGELSGLLRNKSFGEKKARKIEKDAGMPVRWLDEIEPSSHHPHDAKNHEVSDSHTGEKISIKMLSNNMQPVIPRGSAVGVDGSLKSIVDGEIYAINYNGYQCIKILYSLPGGGLRLRNYNVSEYPDENLTAEEANQVRVIGWVECWTVVRQMPD